MFKYWKEVREYKRENLKYINFLLFSVCNVVVEYQNSQKEAEKSKITSEDAIKIMNNLKGLDQKDIVNSLVQAIKSNEVVAKNETSGE